MARDQYEYDVGGALKDQYGREQLLIVDKHTPPLSTDVERGYSWSDADGRRQVVIAGDLRTSRVVNAKDYQAMGNGVTDDTSALLAASEAARNGGRKLYIPTGSYKVSGSITNDTNPNPLSIEGDDPSTTLLLQASGITVPIITSTGSLGTAATVTSASSAGADQLVVSSTAGLAAGDIVLLRDSTQPIYGNTGGGTRGVCTLAGEYAEIKSVDSSTQLTFYGRLDYGYSTSADLRKLSPVSHAISGLGFRNLAPGSQPTTARAILLNYFYKVNLDHLWFDSLDGDGIYLQWGTDFRITNPTFRNLHDLETANNPYGIIVGKGAQDGIVSGAKSRYGRHVFTTGGVAATEVGQSYIKVMDSIATEHSQAGFDCHPGARKITFENLTVRNQYPGAAAAIQVRGPDCDVLNPTIDQCDVGVSFIYGADRGQLVGGRIDRALTGVNFQDSDDCFVGGDLLIENPVTSGITLTRDAGWAANMSTVSYGDLRVTGSPTNVILDNTAAAVVPTFAGQVRTPTAVILVAKTKAGAPVDGDFGITPPNGTVVVDTTNNKIWTRIAGVWKGVVVA